MKGKNQNIEVKKERLITINVDITFIIKIIFIGLLLVGIWYVLHYKHVYIYLHETSKYEYYLFMILVSVLTLLATMCIGIWFGNLGKFFKLIIIILVLYFVYLGYEYLGFGIDIRSNFGLLRYSIFETNSRKGIKFFIENVYLIIIIYFISLPFESEK